ncbi:hypothetical protein [Flavobacterium sp. '19STA2R22 D10 B1']|uniref:hypothetical protein n=1 Tax=Flavobacterium aerium TaxID=3037261 RepID=UPI00278C69AC|nr:hypothetical protein [Flavobacterium sp. '19STA2R22 D10 B1']
MKKNIIASLFLVFLAFTATAQKSDFKFDYLLEYDSYDGSTLNYYINSKDASYILSDGAAQSLIKEGYQVTFNISIKGELRLTNVIPDPTTENTTKFVAGKTDNSIVTINGFKCKKYTYTTELIDDYDETIKHPITYEAYIMEDNSNSLTALNNSAMVIPDYIKYKNFPKGTLVEFKNVVDSYYVAQTNLSLKKITRLDQPIEIAITSNQITDYLIKNQKKAY